MMQVMQQLLYYIITAADNFVTGIYMHAAWSMQMENTGNQTRMQKLL